MLSFLTMIIHKSYCKLFSSSIYYITSKSCFVILITYIIFVWFHCWCDIGFRFNELEEKYGKLDPLAHIDLTPNSKPSMLVGRITQDCKSIPKQQHWILNKSMDYICPITLWDFTVDVIFISSHIVLVI